MTWLELLGTLGSHGSDIILLYEKGNITEKEAKNLLGPRAIYLFDYYSRQQTGSNDLDHGSAAIKMESGLSEFA